jgi:hypothetical protein
MIWSRNFDSFLMLDILVVVQIDLCDGKFVESMTWPFSQYGDAGQFLQQVDDFEIDSELLGLLHHFKIDYDLMVQDARTFIFCLEFVPA